jgi:hypothetical protein
MITQGAIVLPVVTRGIRPVSNTKFVDSIDLEVTVYDGHRIASHFSRTCLMGVSRGSIAYEIFKIDAFQIARHNFAFRVMSKHSRIADFAAKFDTSHRGAIKS